MDFSKIKGLTIPDGVVTKIMRKSDGIVLWSAGRLPSAYQEVEWIGTDGNSYFVSDFTINDYDKFTLYYTYSSPPSEFQYMFGANGPTYTARFLHRYNNFVINTSIDSGNVFLFYFIHDNAFHSYKIQFEHEGEVIAYQDNSLIAQNTFYNMKNFLPFGVMCNNYSGKPSTYKAVNGSKISELRFVDDTTGKDVFNPVPCYRKSDGVIGMYDTVGKKFYTNEGTGSFTRGADVTESVAIEIPITWLVGYGCQYTVGGSLNVSANSDYCVTERIDVQAGKSYKVTVLGTANTGFRVVGADDNDIVTEVLVDTPIVANQEVSAGFSPSQGTTQIRLRSYAGANNYEWKLTKN